jgi:hypothetical protein
MHAGFLPRTTRGVPKNVTAAPTRSRSAPGSADSGAGSGMSMPAVTVEAIGYLAAVLVFATFCMRSMVLLRAVAIASNIAFIAYGYYGQLAPVLLLHVLLMAVNAYQILQLTLHCAGADPRKSARLRVSPRKRAGREVRPF